MPSRYIGSRIKSIYDIEDGSEFDLDENLLEQLRNMDFPVISEEKAGMMKAEILKAREEGDSVGGVVEVYILNLPAGLGEPFFDSLESRLSQMIFSIPSIKGIEFGAGFGITKFKGSKANDPYFYENGEIFTKGNNNGGVLGGLSNGMPVLFRAAVKPTPSISKEQTTIDIKTMKNEKIEIQGRHDPCIVPRALPAIEGAAALVILDIMLETSGYEDFVTID
jgi:chorismate synthase